MRYDFCFSNQGEDSFVSLDLINSISQDLIALTETEEELESLVNKVAQEQYIRKEAWKMAYKECPLPVGSVSLEIRREIQEKRNELADLYYEELLKKYQ